jgi:hypothetical protein
MMDGIVFGAAYKAGVDEVLQTFQSQAEDMTDDELYDDEALASYFSEKLRHVARQFAKGVEAEGRFDGIVYALVNLATAGFNASKPESKEQ